MMNYGFLSGPMMRAASNARKLPIKREEEEANRLPIPNPAQPEPTARGGILAGVAQQVAQAIGAANAASAGNEPALKPVAGLGILPKTMLPDTTVQPGDVPGAIPSRNLPGAIPGQNLLSRFTNPLDRTIERMDTIEAGMPEASLATPGFNPDIARMPSTMTPSGPLDEEVPIPNLPGRGGGARPYDPQAKAEYEYVMRKMPRDEDGNERKLTRGERFKGSLLPALLGMVQGVNSSGNTIRDRIGGAIGGFGAGMAGGIADPVAARQYEWQQMYKPEMDAAEERQQETLERQRAADRGLLDLEGRKADIDYRRAQADATRAGMKDAALERELRQSQIRLNEARAEAVSTGKPQIRDIVDVDGKVRTYQVFPDGTTMELGGSARAAMNEQNIGSREKIAEGRNQTAVQTTQMRQAGATGRTAMTQAGQDRRAAAKTGGGKSGGKVATGAQIAAYAKAQGISVEEARRRAESEGFAVR